MGRNAPPEHIVFKDFKGLRTSIGDPAPNSAISCRNVVRSKKLGHLELGIPYEFRFPTEDANLPQSGDLEISNYLNPAIHKITNLVFENVHNFYVPDHGGRNITVVVGTYTKTGFFPGNPAINRSGLFVRPFWDGAAWVDKWRELTEMFVFEITSLNSASVVPISVPNTGIDVSGAVGTITWETSNPAHPAGWELATDDAYHRKLTLPAGAQSYYLVGQQIRLDWLPAGVTIDGIAFRLLARASSDLCPVKVESLLLVKNGSPTGVAKSDATAWNLVDEEHTIGGAADLWSASFISTDDIGFFLTMKNYDAVSREFFLNRVVIDIYTSTGALMRLNISEGAAPYDFAAADPGAEVFNAEYFKGWTIVYDGFGDNENYDLIRKCGYDGAKYFFDLYHLTDEFDSISVGRKILVYRNFLTAETPSVLSSYCHNVLNEMRVTTGGSPTDLVLMAGFRETTNAIPAYFHRPDLDELVLAHGGAEEWPHAVKFVILGPFDVAPPNDGVATKYYFKYAIVYDDGSRGRLYDAIREYNGTWEADNTTRLLGGTPLSGFRALWSPGAFPKRGRGIAIYMSDDNQYFYKVKELNLVEPTDATPVLPIVRSYSEKLVMGLSGVKHLYAYRNVAITVDDFNTDIPEANADIGRSPADAGIIRYTQAAVIGVHNFAVGVYANGQYQRNKVYSSAIAGSGREEYDIFPDDPIHALSVEYNDADEALSVVGLNNRIAVHKKRSIVLLRYSPNEGYIRDIVTKGWGMAAPRPLAEYDGSLYWLDYSGVMKFNENGIEIINRAWLQDLLALSDSVKEAAIATFDRNNKKYILVLGALVYHYDLLDGEWMIEDWNDLPLRFSIDNTANRVTFLAEDNSGVRNLFVLDEGIIHNGGQYDFSYETNEIDHPSPVPFDLNLMEIYLRYRSTIDFQVTAYKNDTAEVLFGPVTLSKNNYRTLIQLSDDARCSSFRIKVSGRAIDQYTSWKLKRMGMRYQPLEISGDIIVE